MEMGLTGVDLVNGALGRCEICRLEQHRVIKQWMMSFANIVDLLPGQTVFKTTISNVAFVPVPNSKKRAMRCDVHTSHNVQSHFFPSIHKQIVLDPVLRGKNPVARKFRFPLHHPCKQTSLQTRVNVEATHLEQARYTPGAERQSFLRHRKTPYKRHVARKRAESNSKHACATCSR